MYPVSDAFKQAIHDGPDVLAKLEFYFAGELQDEMELLAGAVSDDLQALIRRRFSGSLSGESGLVLPGPTYTPDSPLWPIGNEVKPWAGVRFRDGTEEWVPLGVYRISRPTLDRTGTDFQIAIDAFDRSRSIQRNRFTEPYWVAYGSDYGTEIKNLLKNRMPTLQDSDFNFIPTDGSDDGPIYTTPWLVFVAQDDPWKRATEMAQSCGCELFFDGDGKPTMRTTRDPLYSPADEEYVAGEESTFSLIRRDLDDEQAYNGVIVTGQNADNSVIVPRGEAWDISPGSPTYYDPAYPSQSRYGAVPYFYTSQYVTTNDQAKATAESLLLDVIGIMETVDLSAVANYAHEGGDVIKIKQEDVGVDGMYLLDSFRLELGYAGSMSGKTRKRRVT